MNLPDKNKNYDSNGFQTAQFGAERKTLISGPPTMGNDDISKPPTIPRKHELDNHISEESSKLEDIYMSKRDHKQT